MKKTKVEPIGKRILVKVVPKKEKTLEKKEKENIRR